MTASSSRSSAAVPDAVVPLPRFMERGEGRFVPTAQLRITAPADGQAAKNRLVAGLRRCGIEVEPSGSAAVTNVEIRIVTDADATPPEPESYRLTVTPEAVTIQAAGSAGWGHGVQTFLDLFDAEQRDWPAILVVDGPRFEWRGMLLDCCRHFVTTRGIFRILDGMAAGKLNRFHWHLTDDQAWRIEIKKYPRLTQVAARRADESNGQPQFYSQQDIREVVSYASNLGIEVVPEIEMPGHATAALAAYPELGCSRDPLEVKAAWGLFPHNFNAGDDRVFDFLEAVLDEVVDLFPFPYIHLGADECDKAQWRDCPDCQRRIEAEGMADETALQSYFINRITAFLARRGRTAVGWDEILEGEPQPGMLVQVWRDERIIKLAASRGFAVIASPRRYCYLDMAISQIDLSDVHGFDPTVGLDEASAKMVLGAEANMWTEYVEESELDAMIFPRLWGLGEALWCGSENAATFEDFRARVDGLIDRAQGVGIQPGPALRGDVSDGDMKGRTDLDEKAPGVENLT